MKTYGFIMTEAVFNETIRSLNSKMKVEKNGRYDFKYKNKYRKGIVLMTNPKNDYVQLVPFEQATIPDFNPFKDINKAEKLRNKFAREGKHMPAYKEIKMRFLAVGINDKDTESVLRNFAHLTRY